MQMLRNIAIIAVVAFVTANGLGPIKDITHQQNDAVPVPLDYYFRVMANRTSCDEPCTVHFWVETNDPMIIVFRWDLNGDGKWDYPPQNSPGHLGDWTTEPFLDYNYYDNYDGKVCVEGWDAVSTKTMTYNGTVLNGTPAVDGAISVADFGWKFSPKVNMAVTDLGFWRRNATYPDLSIRLYDPFTGALLAMCSPNGTGGDFWDWCKLLNPVSLSVSASYIVACHKSNSFQPYWTWIDPSRVSWENVTYKGAYYLQGNSWVWLSNYAVPKCDMNFKVTEVVPVTRVACMECSVLNVAPRVSLSSTTITATATLRIAGEKWHDVSAYLVDDTNATLMATLLRQPGMPQETSFPVSIDVTKVESIMVRYTPDDDWLNGRLNGATPAWLTLTLDTGENWTFNHTFNVRHWSTWDWTVNLDVMLAGRSIQFTATATDPGPDDLAFMWEWGDGSPANVSFYPSGGVHPFTAADAQAHAYAMAGSYYLRLTVNDDDGGEVEVVVPLVIP